MSATGEKRGYSEEDLRQALAALGIGNGAAGQAAPIPAAKGGGAVQSPDANAPASGQSGTQSAAFATIEDPKVAKAVMETLGKLEGVADIPAGTPAERVATIFFDPRCPYCHAAFTALRGKVAARWIPVVVLGEPETGNRMAAEILSAPDRLAALQATFENKGAVAGEAKPEMVAKIGENRDAFAGIFAASPNLRPGVPTLFVPRPDGRLAIMVGFDAGDEAKLKSVMTGS